jgi:hypothetical protein
MPHKIPIHHVDNLTKGPSPEKVTQVSNLQNFIQELLGDTHHTFLQGSYRNDTATADINDVDIVAVRKETYSSVHSPHSFSGSINWESIFSEIESKLRAQSRYSSWVVERGDKCIKIRGAFKADVIPAVKVGHDHTTDPVVVYSHKSFLEKPNYPRTFYDNGVAKHGVTNNMYKPTVRMFKNWARNHFNDDEIISSFKIQALVYGVEDNKFFTDMAANFIIIGNRIYKLLLQRNILPVRVMSVCGSEDITANWDMTKRNIFINKLKESLDIANLAYETQSASEAERLWKIAFNL